MKILVTGCAGFIGWKVTYELINRGFDVIGIDNMNNYYDVKLKYWRLEQLRKFKNFSFFKADIEDKENMYEILNSSKVEVIINEAARAGVRKSIDNPEIYFRTNVNGFLNILEIAKLQGIRKVILASTSSIYAGLNMPFKEDMSIQNPISPYAASKLSAEVIASTYNYLYDIDITVLRYFTVYGPGGRPDMSIFQFIYKIKKGEKIQIYGDGNQLRDFTYIDDIVNGTLKALDLEGYQIINLGSGNPIKLNYVIELIEKITNKRAIKDYRSFHKADMKGTWANIDKARQILKWNPSIDVEEGLEKTVQWFKENWYWLQEIDI